MLFTLLIPFLSIVTNTFGTADKSTDYIHQLEQKISDLESHAQASEQKQAAVLASILSKLQVQEEKIQELEEDRQNDTASNSTLLANAVKRVAFEANKISEEKSSLVHFEKVIFNDGAGYDATRGIFTTPTTGTYQFWFTAYVSEKQYGNTPNLINLEVNDSPFGNTYVFPLAEKPNMFLKLVQGQHVVPLTAGDTVSVKGNHSLTVRAGSSFGGVLIG